MASRNKSNVISLTRIYDAPLQAVWDAWAIPEEVAQWWGPRGFTITTHGRDLRTGGYWHYTMHGPDGTEYENTTQYLEIVPLQRMVYDHGGHKDRPPLFRVTMLLSEHAGRTQLDLSFALATPEIAEEMRGFIKKAGGEGTWDRLAEHLAVRCTGKEQFFIARSFDAGIERVFEMWTDPEHLAAWMPPAGATMHFLRADPRVGGSSLYAMTFPDGAVMHGLITYLAIEKPVLITYTQQFCDEQERVIRPPFFKDWPLTMHSTIEFAAESPERTRVTVRWQPQEATDADLAEFVKQRGGMTMGWTGSFDKLEAALG
ncbi:SRPBCC family protein [Zoogloea sp.]|uniref:SRPBCC family protein n=1 Tax=Zoogloea sp. TaxID=49181 RepID=UPI001D936983|nr:SRPBCC family protein [Zoogloea sp.]MBK6653367.1 SRPBCC domain-containing protein [Zoogloea sp.]MBK7847214.1 SRPBCC domain-containing protein [Zoogloea sp.]